MLQIGGDDVIALTEHSFERHVERVGSVEGEDEPLGPFTVEKLVEQMTAVIEGALRGQGHFVTGSTWIGQARTGEPVKCLVDRFGLGKTGGSVIQVDHRDGS